MPHLFFANAAHVDKPASERSLQEANCHDDRSSDKENAWGRTWRQMGNWLKKEDDKEVPAQPTPARAGDEGELNEKVPCQDAVSTAPTHAVVPGLPRPLTFKRQDSERRDRLYPHEPDHEERRASSADRRLGSSYERKAPQSTLPQLQAPCPNLDVIESSAGSSDVQHAPHDLLSTAGTLDDENSDRHDQDQDARSQYDWAHHDLLHHSEQLSDALDELQIQSELEAKWILNLSMHFRDRSDREKFFITYAEEPNKWRRVTVSCDYRHAPEDSLEADLKSLHYQRDKSARIYEAIRDSLPQIQFYPTVTNLKLETSDGRLHVHVTEDVNEIIQYPPLSSVAHLDLPTFSERTIEFDCHMSGFVYKVKTCDGATFIKKEIPGPEAVEEFLYEINALSSLRDSPYVVHLEGLVVDERSNVKGILLNYCEQGALVDLIYDLRYTDQLTWSRRLRWARQIVQGLAEIHEAGFVQGDFTLSNIVISQSDNAHIIDINRRGCPIGWEPPELSRLIQAGQRISMYIGVKSDIFQLGMVLWGLAEQQDEPERQERPLRFRDPELVPQWYREIVEICLSPTPRERLLAKELLAKFPPIEELTHSDDRAPANSAQVPSEPTDVDATIEESGGDLDREDAIHLPIPAPDSTVSSTDQHVDYLLASPEPDKRADSAAALYNHIEPDGHVDNNTPMIIPTEEAISLSLPKENERSATSLHVDEPLIGNRESSSPAVSAAEQIQLKEMPAATILRDEANSTEHIMPLDATLSHGSQSVVDLVSPRISPSIPAVGPQSSTFCPYVPEESKMFSPTLEISSTDARSHLSPGLNSDNPLATSTTISSASPLLKPDKQNDPHSPHLSGLTAKTTTPVPNGIHHNCGNEAIDLGSPTLATLSPPIDNNYERRPSLSLENSHFSKTTPVTIPTSSPPQYSSPVDSSSSTNLGNPPLPTVMATISSVSLGGPPLATISPLRELDAHRTTTNTLETTDSLSENKLERKCPISLDVPERQGSAIYGPSQSSSDMLTLPTNQTSAAEKHADVGSNVNEGKRHLEASTCTPSA
ncbi:uncharacterized protein PV09_03020 [Verruconis gallopava]|uniref:Protein kinase domain-containing protein n=1 Tax=Verruconis gallopava TaxID=253628 RepID=A0A0D2B3F7_9PEZI|nr:uncharacterized protein PV09_03020 [Verruconis gallopava]KIW05814.1 hypothetical protein PV09_03020 [Verruconis gallopava]